MTLHENSFFVYTRIVCILIDGRIMQIKGGKKEPAIRWGVERRMEFIEFRLFWEGRINRADLTSFFGISVPQASADFAQYQGLAPANLEYDASAKQYVAGKLFKPIFLSPGSESYMRQLLSISQGLIDRESSFAGWLPNFDVVPTPDRLVEPHTLFRVLSTIRKKNRLNIQYQSMTNPEPSWRWVSPHALGFDGFRWHIRAYCHTHNEFRDFLFSRILSINEEELSEIDTSSDRLWHEHITLRIGPNPLLDKNKQKVIELDYEMENGERAIRVRGAHFFYLCKRLGFKDDMDMSPEKQYIVPLNWEEVNTLQSHLKDRSRI